MLRLAALALPLALAVPAAAQTNDADKAAGCAATAEIVSDAVELRAGGSQRDAAAQAIAAGDTDAKYAEAIGPLVDWVYTLPEEQLTDEAASAFTDACLAQMG
ncbi:hypothetical protein [Roseovarius aquimarinus]|uniref:DNA primase n=1 Tax=Roseovarius aquimarinus TaxID=1229156 RepID=A0ABW7I9S8_9RHOB